MKIVVNYGKIQRDLEVNSLSDLVKQTMIEFGLGEEDFGYFAENSKEMITDFASFKANQKYFVRLLQNIKVDHVADEEQQEEEDDFEFESDESYSDDEDSAVGSGSD